MQGGAVPGGESGLFHDSDVSVFVRGDVRGLGPWNLPAFGCAIPGVEREEVWKTGNGGGTLVVALWAIVGRGLGLVERELGGWEFGYVC